MYVLIHNQILAKFNLGTNTKYESTEIVFWASFYIILFANFTRT
jgi:hypothetical protein